MSTYHQTIVVELGSSRIKVGFAGESRPRRVLHGDTWSCDNESGWQVPINDAVGARPCNWGRYFQYLTSPASSSTTSVNVTSTHEWERSLYQLFSHIITSILFLQRPSRHRMIVLLTDLLPPRYFCQALHRVLLDYLCVGRILVLNGGGFVGMSFLLDGLSSALMSRPKAYLLVDIGTHEARVIASVAGSSLLVDSFHSTMSGYHSFLQKVLQNYQDRASVEQASDALQSTSSEQVLTLADAHAIVQAWINFSSTATPETSIVHTLLVNIPSCPTGSSIPISIQPLLEAFHRLYLDYTDPSSLIHSILCSILACPISYRRVALQNVILLGGGSVALQHFCFPSNLNSFQPEECALTFHLMKAAKEACAKQDHDRSNKRDIEEKKEDMSQLISPIARHRFQSLSAIVNSKSITDESGEGIRIRYPEPFAADVAFWVGGSIMGSLDLKNKGWLMKSGGSENDTFVSSS